jgi:lysophospholipase L1-like esterase
MTPEIEDPEDVLLRITSSAICGTDLHMYDGRTGCRRLRKCGGTATWMSDGRAASARMAKGSGNSFSMGKLTRHTRVSLVYLAAGLLVVAASIAVALVVTPLQQVSVVGEEIGVGAAAPSFSVSGPGEVDLFGQQLPTTLQFAGPVRPRLALTQITLNRQLDTLFAQRHKLPSSQAIGQTLASGWTRYFAWEVVVTGGCALLLTGAIAGWARFSLRRTLALLGIGLVLAEAVNLGGIMVTAYSAPARLREVGSLTGLVGQSSLPIVARAPGPAQANVQAVVLGDSTAAGLGNPPLAHPSQLDSECHRSVDAYAADLAAVNSWNVLNLACSGATIQAGILGPQQLAHTTAPAQLAEAKKATHASVVIVSIGANDLGWSGLVRLCAATASCDNRASTAYFQQRLATFASQYYQLLQQLATLPSHPRVLVNLYYDPFDAQSQCLASKGLDGTKEQSLVRLLDALNRVLSNGARAASQTPVQPDFTGHALCDPGPYVQSVQDPAPLHPTAAGQLAIALADEQALQQPESTPGPSPATTEPSTPATLMPGTPAATAHGVTRALP